MALASEFDAIVVGTSSRATVCGLTLVERARRVALKAGAGRVLVVDAVTPLLDEVRAWAAAEPSRRLVVVDVREHVIHVPLIQAALGASSAVVVEPSGAFAGAMLADVGQRDELLAAVTRPDGLADLAARWREQGLRTEPYGELARHPARTARERKEAVYFLFGLIRKAQDSWLVRNFNRKVSYPFTRVLLPLKFISPNMISIAVFLMGAIGCYVMTTPTYGAAVLGTGIILFAGYIDGCDGEVARLRLESSKLGAWIDTMADEATTVLTVVCVGIHVYRLHPLPWLGWTVVIAGILAAIGVLLIYYYLLTSGGSGNSQDYPTSSRILAFLRYLIRREMVNLGSFALCLLGLVEVLYTFLAIGALVSSSVLGVQTIQRMRTPRPAEATAPASSPTGS